MEQLAEALKQVTGYIYPNEVELYWGLLIVVYPYITGLVAGAFILASLVRVFNVRVLHPAYRLALLTALSFMLVAPLPLLCHLGHPERGFQIMITPNLTSAMAMFGFVYAWYLMVVLQLEIWFDYRKDLVLWSEKETGFRRFIHRVLTLGAMDLSPKTVAVDDHAGRWLTIIGIPSAFLLHGYVGFIFGSVKANPWWSSVLIPIVFIFSAIVSGIALMLLLYMFTTLMRGRSLDMPCLDKLASFLFYALVVDFSLEFLDFIHRLYEAEESIQILGQLVTTKLFLSLVIVQALNGTIIPLILLGLFSPALTGRKAPLHVPDELRRLIYAGSAVLIEIGILCTRYNIVIGGQLFSKSLRGLMTYKMQWLGMEGLFVALLLLGLPLVILAVLIWLLPPWPDKEAHILPVQDTPDDGDEEGGEGSGTELVSGPVVV